MKDKLKKNSLNLVSIIMRQKINLLITVFSISLLFLYSCDKEIYDDAIYQSQQPQNLSISKISFKELKSNKKAVERIKNVITKKLPSSIAQRAVYNDDFGVYIDTTNIVKMVSATEESLTFNIVDYTDSTKKENLILVTKNDGNFEAYIAEYNLTQQDLIILESGGSLENIKPTSISEVESTLKMAISSSCSTTSIATEYVCNPSNGGASYSFGFSYSGGCSGTMTYLYHSVVTIDMACLAAGGGGGGGNSSSSGNSGNSGNSGTSGSGSGYTGSGPGGGSTNIGSNVFSDSSLNTTFVPCSTCVNLTASLDNFLGTLNPDQLAFWNSINLDYYTKRTITNYLMQNNYSSKSVAFVKESLTALNEGGEVDFNKQVILDQSFVNSPKIKCLYDKLVNGSNNNLFII